MVGDRESGVRRGVLRDEADLRQLRRVGGRSSAAHLDRPHGRGQDPDHETEQRGLAGAVRPDQTGDPADRDLEGAVPQRPASPVLLAQAAGRHDGAHAISCAHGAKRAHEERLDALLVEPGRSRLVEPSTQVAAQWLVRGQRGVGQGSGDEGADSRPGGDEPVALQLAVGLEDGVRVDRQARHHVLDGGQLVALDQQAEAQGPPYLVDDLKVRRDPRAGVQRELDHRELHSSSYLAH